MYFELKSVMNFNNYEHLNAIFALQLYQIRNLLLV